MDVEDVYKRQDTEILIEVTPKFVEIWDTRGEEEQAFQVFIDFDTRQVEVKQYD